MSNSLILAKLRTLAGNILRWCLLHGCGSKSILREIFEGEPLGGMRIIIIKDGFALISIKSTMMDRAYIELCDSKGMSAKHV